jgi:hypothetical protein
VNVWGEKKMADRKAKDIKQALQKQGYSKKASEEVINWYRATC